MSEDYYTLPEFSDYSLFEDCLNKKTFSVVNGQDSGTVKVEEEDRLPPSYYGVSSCRYATPGPHPNQPATNQHHQPQQINQPAPMVQQQQPQQSMPQMCPPQAPQSSPPPPPGYPYAPSPAYTGGAQVPVTNPNNQSQYEHIVYNSNSPASYSPASPYSSSLGSPVGNQNNTEDFMPLRQALFNRHAASISMGAAGPGGYGLQFGSFYEQQMLEGKRRKHDFELTPEEYEKRRLRRERNKQAALRCRQRRRERIDELELETAKIEKENNAQRNEIARLEKQVSELAKMLKEHQCGRPETETPCTANTPSSQTSNTSVIQSAVPLSRSVRTLSTFDINVKNEN